MIDPCQKSVNVEWKIFFHDQRLRTLTLLFLVWSVSRSCVSVVFVPPVSRVGFLAAATEPRRSSRFLAAAAKPRASARLPTTAASSATWGRPFQMRESNQITWVEMIEQSNFFSARNQSSEHTTTMAHWIYQKLMLMSWPETTEHTNVLYDKS